MKLSGHLSEFHLGDIIQFLAMSHKAGELRLNDEKHVLMASIYFGNEKVLHAQLLEKEGLPAFEAVYMWRDGDFNFFSERPPPRITIDLPVQTLILNLQCRIDELRSLEKELPPVDAVLAITPEVADVPALNSAEWRVLSLINGRRTIKSICQKMGDELFCKRTLLKIQEKGLIEIIPQEMSWKSLMPKIKPANKVNCERPYPPLVRTNLLLKAIDGQSRLKEIQEILKFSDSDMLEDLHFLYETQWITFPIEDEKIFLLSREES